MSTQNRKRFKYVTSSRWNLCVYFNRQTDCFWHYCLFYKSQWTYCKFVLSHDGLFYTINWNIRFFVTILSHLVYSFLPIKIYNRSCYNTNVSLYLIFKLTWYYKSSRSLCRFIFSDKSTLTYSRLDHQFFNFFFRVDFLLLICKWNDTYALRTSEYITILYACIWRGSW